METDGFINESLQVCIHYKQALITISIVNLVDAYITMHQITKKISIHATE